MGMTQMNFEGIIVGLATFLIIGIFHPIVIKAEYHFGTRCWWAFLLAGCGFAALSLFLDDLVWSTIAGVTAFSCFWSILELFQQKKRHFMIFCCEFREIRSKKFAEPEFLSTFAIPFGETLSQRAVL